MQNAKVVTDALTGAQFNDYEKLNAVPMGLETKDEVHGYSTQVCSQHAKQYNMADGLESEMGSGRCGVVGCEREAEHYYYFNTRGEGTSRRARSATLESEPFSELPLITPTIPGTPRTPRKRRKGPGEPGASVTGVV